jgi:hypothetical protein
MIDMRYIPIALALLLSASQAWGVVLIQREAASGTFCENISGEILCEEFEGSGTPTSWTVSSGTADFDNTSTPLDGSESAVFSATSQIDIAPSGMDVDDIWIYFEIETLADPSDYTTVFALISSGNQRGGCTARASDGNWQCIARGGSAPGYIIDPNGYIKMHLQISDGSNNGFMNVYTSSDGTTWSLVSESTGGTLLTNWQSASFYLASDKSIKIDNFAISESDLWD